LSPYYFFILYFSSSVYVFPPCYTLLLPVISSCLCIFILLIFVHMFLPFHLILVSSKCFSLPFESPISFSDFSTSNVIIIRSSSSCTNHLISTLRRLLICLSICIRSCYDVNLMIIEGFNRNIYFPTLNNGNSFCYTGYYNNLISRPSLM